MQIKSSAIRPADVQKAIADGAQGIGLVRTESMFFDYSGGKELLRDVFLEERQNGEAFGRFAGYQKQWAGEILDAAQGKGVTFRLLQAKLTDYLDDDAIYKLHGRSNGYDDLQGGCLLYKSPNLVRTQSWAILAAAHERGVGVDLLVPMADWSFENVKEYVQGIAGENGFSNYRVGAMIESVKVANSALDIAKDADFISFGLNDLTQDVTDMRERRMGDINFEILHDRVKAIAAESVRRIRIVNPEMEIGFCGTHSSVAKNLDFYREVGASYIVANPDSVPKMRKHNMEHSAR